MAFLRGTGPVAFPWRPGRRSLVYRGRRRKARRRMPRRARHTLRGPLHRMAASA